jgi:hypothetical protein
MLANPVSEQTVEVARNHEGGTRLVVWHRLAKGRLASWEWTNRGVGGGANREHPVEPSEPAARLAVSPRSS